MRSYLVFFRAGGNSLHRRLLVEDVGRNWDCCVSWYCPPMAESEAEYYVTDGDNKMDAFEQFYRKTLVKLSYRYYLVVDDDIYFSPGDISRFFAICDQYKTFLCQPALRWGTNANHDVTLWNPLCTLRQASYVEVMTPCFSQQAVEELLMTFSLTRSTWGIDYAWASLLRHQGKIAIVDAIRVAHMKPVDMSGGAFYRKLEAQGIDVWKEYDSIKRTFPAFGAFSTLPGKNVMAWSLLQWIPFRLVRLMDSVKKRIHRYMVTLSTPSV